MSKFIKTSVTLTKDDKEFIESNSISLSKLVRKTINDKKNSLSQTTRQTRRKKTPGKGLYNV